MMSVERFQSGGCGLRPAEEPENPEDVNIQCIQSSEFVVGKQDNFNGPVTIINCVEKTATATAEDRNNQMKEEKIIIRDKVLSKAATDATPERKEDLLFLDLLFLSWWKRSFRKLGKHHRVVLLVCGILITVIIALGVFFGLTQTAGEFEMIGKRSFYTKKAWGGKPSTLSVEMKLPLPYVIISHTVTTMCWTLRGCSPRLKNMQDYHFQLEFSDISYNFLIDSGGNIYEGRGWNKRNIMGSFVNGRSIDIGLIGDYSQGNNIPTNSLLDALRELLEYGLDTGKISENYTLAAASSIYPTLSPGKYVYEIIKEWPHFDPDPKSHVKEYEV